jgi:anthranilate synthase component 1
MLSFEEFESLARDHNVIPLIRTTLADLHTPVSAYLGLRKRGELSFLFESVEPDEKIGRYSFVGVDPAMTIRAREGTVEIWENGSRVKREANIFDLLRDCSARYRQPAMAGADGFLGGFVGYLGYPAVAHLERLSLRKPDLEQEDEAVFGMFGSILRFDHRRQTVTIVHNVILNGNERLREAYDKGVKAVEALELKLRRSVVVPQNFSCDIPPSDGSPDRAGYCASVDTIKRHIVDGDIFQAVLSRRLKFGFEGDMFPVYRALRMINPSPYLFYLEFNDTQLAGSSPEVLVRVIGGVVELLPIAGTRPRGAGRAEDERLEQELLADRKELAEHVMLVDLGRNDVGRISSYGSVSVPVFKRVERYSHVMHIVSEVRGTLRDGLTSLDALKACFPAGTVSGAPKVRAMEIINDLEPVSRGAYAGAVGYLGFNGSLDTCIAIRTVIAHRGKLSIQTGAGIVADSVPGLEYDETINKARALMLAVKSAANGLRSAVPE